MVNAEKLKKRMKEMEVKQKDLADAIGIAAPTVSQKLSGVRPLNLDEACIIANKLHITPEDFGVYFFSPEVA